MTCPLCPQPIEVWVAGRDGVIALNGEQPDAQVAVLGDRLLALAADPQVSSEQLAALRLELAAVHGARSPSG